MIPGPLSALCLLLLVQDPAPAQAEASAAQEAAAPSAFSKAAAAKVVAEAPEAMQLVTAKRIKEHAFKLAGGEFQGRLTGTPGQKKAAAYVEDALGQLGLEPWGDELEGGKRSFLQRYPVTLFGIDDESGLYLGKERICQHGGWFNLTGPLTRQRPVTSEGKLVFAGRYVEGMDVADLPDLEGCIAVFTMEWPQPDRRSGQLPGIYQAMQGMIRFAPQLNRAERMARDNNAVGTIVLIEDYDPVFLAYANMAGVCRGCPLVARGHTQRPGGMIGFGGGGGRPVFVAGGKDAADVLAALGLDASKVFAKGSTVGLGAQTRKQCRLEARPFREETEASNVVALLRGSDEALAEEEAVVYSCHMDHNGPSFDGGAFWGADDNASGTSSVLAIAEAYAKLKGDERPQRSVLFVVVSGEEKGLWGSDHFTRNPTWPLENILADINMDMIGRSTDKVPHDAIAVTPSNRLRQYSNLTRDAVFLGQELGMRFTNGDKFYSRSDHINFARKGIPIVFFCDDEHPDYHMTTDTPDKLEYDKLERIGRISFLVGYRVTQGVYVPDSLGSKEDWFSDR